MIIQRYYWLSHQYCKTICHYNESWIISKFKNLPTCNTFQIIHVPILKLFSSQLFAILSLSIRPSLYSNLLGIPYQRVEWEDTLCSKYFGRNHYALMSWSYERYEVVSRYLYTAVYGRNVHATIQLTLVTERTAAREWMTCPVVSWIAGIERTKRDLVVKIRLIATRKCPYESTKLVILYLTRMSICGIRDNFSHQFKSTIIKNNTHILYWLLFYRYYNTMVSMT